VIVSGEAPAIAPFLERHGSLRVARPGPLEHPSFMAIEDGRVVGVVRNVVGGEACELLTLHADPPARGRHGADRGGGGRDPLRSVVADHHQRQRRRAALLPAPRIPARRAAPRCGDVSRATLKPEIPEVGDHGIPLRDEVELERVLD
jgi:hypothetical protein